ncbi:hypothetical protein F511_16282 [Dorcoceras hygrometricum]|uniref:Uncharacterized protein n=1 Tax=Dorcoceras hygrometricum TaxID=472368 RepID=A0A2Z7AZJ5_9LAMI|nr:hypothetical protein F511_16282 [Dorcoceras hygrometricum]
MSLFGLQDVRIAIGSIATLDLPMVVDLIGIYGLKGSYCMLTTTNWFLQALSVIPGGSWGDVARRSYHDPLGKSGIVIPEPQWLWAHGITDSACKNQSIMVSVQYGPFNTYIPIRSTTIGKSRVDRDPITMHTSWRSNSDIMCVTRADLGELVKLHPQKVLTNKSVDTYIKKNLGVGLAGETSNVSGTTASEQKSTRESLMSFTNRAEKEADEKKKTEKKAVEARSQADPAKSKSGTGSDEDSFPLLRLKKGGGKRKFVVESSDSESTVSIPPVLIMKRHRTKRRKKTEKLAATNEGAIVVRSVPEQPAQQSFTFAGKGIFAPVEIREINWATHILTKIDPAVKGKEMLKAFARPNLVEEHCQLVLKTAWEYVSSKMADYDYWVHLRTAGSANSCWSTSSSSRSLNHRRCCNEDLPQITWSEARKSLLTGSTSAQTAQPQVLALEFSTQEEQKRVAAKQSTQQAEQVEEIVRTVENVEGTEAVNSPEHQAHGNEQHAQMAYHQAP